MTKVKQFKWKRFGGFDCSSKGCHHFSAFNAILEDGRSIELHYQCDVKGYDPGGKKWWKGKGKPPLNTEVDLYVEYLKLWKQWAKLHPGLITYLRTKAIQFKGILSDRFATSPVNQARALSDILNEQEHLLSEE